MAGTELVEMLDLETVGPNRFRAQPLAGTRAVVFGGQLLAQSLAAAARSIDGMQVKSMHTVFLRGARPDEVLEIDVEPLHAGRTFGASDVTVRQGERICTKSVVLHHVPDDEVISHQADPPEIGSPEEAAAISSNESRGWEVRIAREADIFDPDAIGPAELYVWSRFRGVPPEPWASQALLGYASDGFLIGTAMRPHPGVGQDLAHVSIDTSVITQTLTFHDDFDAGEWLVLAHRSPVARHGRTFGRADVYTSEGRLVASYSQENLVRKMPRR
jgi:acyl-CoA thioesterase II